MDNDGHAEYTVPGDALLSRDNLYIRNALIQNFTENRGKLFQAKGDVDYDLDGFLSNVAAGVRYAHSSAEEQALNLNRRIQGGNITTAYEDAAVLVSNNGPPDDSIVLVSLDTDPHHASSFSHPTPDIFLPMLG